MKLLTGCNWLLLGVLLPVLAAAAPLTLPGALIEPEWLIERVPSEGLVLVDIQEAALFRRHHIPGAVNWPFSEWRTGPESLPPKSLLSIDHLEQRLGRLGIQADTPLVIVATGTSSADMSAAARVFWTLKVLGHGPVGVLNGGLLSYVNEHHGVFDRGTGGTREAVSYQAEPNLDLLATDEWLADSVMPRLDARTLEEHVGLLAGPDERPGTLPGARHLPFDWLTHEGSGRLRPRDQLEKLFAHAGILGEAAVHFCHTGNRASLTWFVDYALMGNTQARLYDASMIEWARDPGRPMEIKLKL